MASYPAALKTWVPRVNLVDNVMAADINTAYDEVTAIETQLGTQVLGAGIFYFTGLSVGENSYVPGSVFIKGTDAAAAAIYARINSDTDEAVLLHLEKRNAAVANTKAWRFLIDDTTGGLRIQPNNNDAVFGVINQAKTLNRLWLDTGTGFMALGDSSNVNMTQGLTINQGVNDDEILALKASEVAHGMTDLAETDTYEQHRKVNATAGGALLAGFTEDVIGLQMIGYSTNDNTTKTAAGLANVLIDGWKKAGTGAGAPGANANLLAVRSATNTRFIMDVEGDGYYDGAAWANYDEHVDIDLLTALSVEVSKPGDPIKLAFADFMNTHRAQLEALKLVQFNEDGHHFYNLNKLTMLLVGAVRQLSTRLALAESKLTQLPEG